MLILGQWNYLSKYSKPLFIPAHTHLQFQNEVEDEDDCLAHILYIIFSVCELISSKNLIMQDIMGDESIRNWPQGINVQQANYVID